MSLATRRDYVHLQGEVYYRERDAVTGDPGPARFLGNAKSLSIQTETNIIEHFESTSGQRVMDNRYQFGIKLNATLEFDQYDPETMALAIKGTTLAIASGTVSHGQDNMPSGMTAGTFFRTRFGNISSVVIQDSATTPATLTLGTHYRIADAKAGLIEILDPASFTQPFRPAYSYAAARRMVALNDGTPPELWLELNGINVAAQSKRVNCTIYRFAFNMTESLMLLNDEPTMYTLQGAVLREDKYATGSDYTNFGQYFNIVRLE